MGDAERKDIGALWLKRSEKNGTQYFSGKVVVNGVTQEIVIFKNDFKKQPKHPDYRIYPSQPRQAGGGSRRDDTFDDDVPF
jgi:uncharacterized protein (DUF736 family)